MRVGSAEATGVLLQASRELKWGSLLQPKHIVLNTNVSKIDHIKKGKRKKEKEKKTLTFRFVGTADNFVAPASAVNALQRLLV